MKMTKGKTIAMAVLLLCAFALTAFIPASKGNGNIKDTLKGKKVLVLYFSRAGDNYKVGKVDKGNTAFLAEYIAEMTGADVFEITSKKNYDIPYTKMLQTVREEWENDEYPDFVKPLPDIDKYDVVFVGGPIWWGTYPRVMFSFFKKHNLNGKIIVPFTTNEGSGLGNVRTDLHRLYPDAIITEGFSMPGHEARLPGARETVRQWLDNLSLKAGESVSPKVDATTGATPMVNQPTAKGQEYEETEKQTVEIKYSDGRVEKKEIVVKGAVDLGLSASWSATNLGADKPWETGDHYAWGETETKDSFMESNYPYYHKEIGNDISKTWYDAARRQWGGDWRMPTRDEWHELLFNTNLEWVTIEGRQGYLFTAKNGSSLFLPANGYIYDKTVGTPDECYYWTSTYSNIDNAYVAYLPSNSWGLSNYGRYIGIGIRPVK